MSETLKNIENTEIKSIVKKMEQLDKEFNSKSSQLSRKLVNVEESIENLKKDEQLYQKYNDVIRDLESMLEDLRDGNIDEEHNYNKSHENIDYIDIPKGHVVSYEGIINNGDKFIISRPEKNGSYSDFKLFIESNGKQNEVTINNVTRYRDGGTTYVETEIGKFYFPTPFNKDAIPTFTDKDGKITNIETGEKIDILNTLKNITPNELFEKNQKAYDTMYNNYFNEATMTNEALSLFKEKVQKYASAGGYEIKNGFKMRLENGKFIIEYTYLSKVPKGEEENKSPLKIYFGD